MEEEENIIVGKERDVLPLSRRTSASSYAERASVDLPPADPPSPPPIDHWEIMETPISQTKSINPKIQSPKASIHGTYNDQDVKSHPAAGLGSCKSPSLFSSG